MTELTASYEGASQEGDQKHWVAYSRNLKNLLGGEKYTTMLMIIPYYLEFQLHFKDMKKVAEIAGILLSEQILRQVIGKRITILFT